MKKVIIVLLMSLGYVIAEAQVEGGSVGEVSEWKQGGAEERCTMDLPVGNRVETL